MVRGGTLPAMKIGGVFRFDPKEIESWAKAKQYQTKSAHAIKPARKTEDANLLEQIKNQADILTKRLLFVGLLTRKLVDQKTFPVIVGDNAVEFYKYQKERRKFLGKRLSLGLKRLPSNRPRDEEERAILRRLDKFRWETWLSTGKLQKLGPRRYQFRV